MTTLLAVAASMQAGSVQSASEAGWPWLAAPSLAAPWLAGLAIRTSVLLAIALTLVALLRSRSAALRHWLLAAAIGCALAMPLLGAIVPAWGAGDGWPLSLVSSALGAGTGNDAREAPARALVQAEDSQQSTPSLARWFALSLSQAPPRATGDTMPLVQRLSSALPTTFVTLWLAGVAIALLPLIAGYARLRSIARRSHRIAHGRWRAMADEVARELGLRRPIALLGSDQPSLLVTWGLAHPRVLLPASAAQWSDQTLRIVLLHELAHVQRGDWAIQMAAELLRALCWFNPLAWLACTRLRRESELACDDAVLGRGIDRADYAAQVLDVARTLGRHRRSFAAVATAMAHYSGLERRIRIMLNDRLNRAPLTRSARIATAVALIAIALPLAGFSAAQNQSSITGTVVDQSGAPIADAEITVTRTGGERRTFTADANGRFDADGLAAGPYVLLVKSMGFAPMAVSLTLAPGQHFERRLSLAIGHVQETMVQRGANPTPKVTAPLSESQIHEIVTAPGNAQESLTPPSRLRAAMPAYPPALHDAGVQGTVVLEGDIGVDGAIANLAVMQSVNPELDALCRDAVLQWRYSPTRLHGAPVAVHIRMVFEFQL